MLGLSKELENLIKFSYRRYLFPDIPNIEKAISPGVYSHSSFVGLDLKNFFYKIEPHSIPQKYRFFLFRKGDINILYPENLSDEQIKTVEEILSEKEDDFLALWAYTVYYYNSGKLDLLDKFKTLMKLDPANPDLLARLSRYYASSLYKMYRKDPVYLAKGLVYGLKAQKIRETKIGEQYIPPFIYAWNGYIYMELDKNEKALSFYNKSIYLNKKYYNGYEQAEPFIWKAFALTKLGKFEESNNILLRIENHPTINQPSNDKRDFRFFRRIAENYIGLGDKTKAYTYLEKTISKFLEIFKFHIDYNGDVLEINLNNPKLILKNEIFKNRYESFIEYYKNLIKNNEIGYIILSLAYLYKEKLNGEFVEFYDTRDIEKVCFNYLTQK